MKCDLFKKIYNTLEQVDVRGYQNIARMKLALDALEEVDEIFDKAMKEVERHENHDKQRENV